MPVKLILRCPANNCRKKFQSDTWRLRHIRTHHPEHAEPGLKTSHARVVPIAQRRRRPVRPREFNANKDPVEDPDALPYIEHLNERESTPPPQPYTETFPKAGAPLLDYLPQQGESDADGCLEDNLTNNPYYPFATREEYNYVRCGIKKKGMKTYYDTVLKEENTSLRFPSFKNGTGVQRLVAAMPDDKALGEWESHTLTDMLWNDDHPQPIKYMSRDIIKCMRWLMRQPAYADDLTYAPQRCFNGEGKRLYGEMHTADWWWQEQVSKDPRPD
jgi:hypothetical protein